VVKDLGSMMYFVFALAPFLVLRILMDIIDPDKNPKKKEIEFTISFILEAIFLGSM